MSTPCTISVEDKFGPVVAKVCYDGFDFTLLFEEVILGITPLALALLICVPFRLFQLAKRSQLMVSQSGRWLYRLKVMAYTALCVLQIAQLVILAKSQTPKTQASFTLAALSLAGTIFFCLLSHFEHWRAQKPSTLLNAYFLASLLLDSARTRTLWAIQDARDLAIIAVFLLFAKAWIVGLEATRKRKLSTTEEGELSKEGGGGILDRLTFWWLNPLLLHGYRTILRVEEMPKVDESLVSDDLLTSMKRKWKAYNPNSSNSLLFALLSQYKWQLLAGISPRLCYSAFTFAQPFLVSRILDYIQEPDTANTKRIGYGLVGAMGIVYSGLAVTNTFYQHKTYRLITLFRGSLVSLIYHKTLHSSPGAVDMSSSITLMSADVERVGTGMRFVHEVWASPIDIGIAIFLLERQLGFACVAPAALFGICTLLGLKTASSVGFAQKLWLEKTQIRVSATNETLGSIKGMKMSGLTPETRSTTKALRSDELKTSLKFKSRLVVIVTLSYITAALAPVLAFTVFILVARATHGTSLNITNAFTSLTLFSVLQQPMTLLIEAVQGIFQTTSCLERIRVYLSIDSKPNEQASIDEKNECRVSWIVTQQSSGFTEKSLVKFSQVNSGWGNNGPFQLRELNFNILMDNVTMIVGPVASGKSTLLKTILRQVSRIEGEISAVSCTTAFCNQTPWLTNDTIMDNILGVSVYNQQWYDTVIYKCGLVKDIAQLQQGHQTRIGSKGVVLSGGQQQRVALARAIYAKKALVILDDVMSGLDPETDELLFSQLFGQEGLFKQNNMTVIMTTNAVHRLSYADHIIVLGQDGLIVEQGSYDKLRTSSTYLHGLLLREKNKTTKNSLDNVASSSAEPVQISIPEISTERGTGSFQTYVYLTRMVGWFNIVVFFLLGAGFVFGLSFPQIWVQWWAQANENMPNQRIGYYVGIYMLLSVSAVIFLALCGWHLMMNIVPESSTKSHTALLEAVLNAPLSYFNRVDVGTIANRFSQDITLIDMEIPLAGFNTMVEFLTVIAQGILIAVTAEYIAPVVPACMVVFFAIQRFYLRTSRQMRLVEIEAKAPLFRRFLEALNGISTIKAFGWERELEQQFSEALNTSQKPYYYLWCIQRWLNLVLQMTIAGLAVLLTLIVVLTKGKLSAGNIGVSLVNIVGFGTTVKTLMTNWTILETSLGALQRVKQFVESVETEDRVEETLIPPEEWPQNGKIEFEGFSASYSDLSPDVLSNISLCINKGEKVAICGRTGSGKSSLLSTILRTLDAHSGRIVIDGIDISKIPRNVVRSRMIALPQQPYLIYGSIRKNIDPRHTATDEEIDRVMDRVGLKGFIKSQGDLDLKMGEDFFSQGQKQLLCLGRAMLTKGSLLILDEATSSVDFETDKLMQDIIRTHFEDHTVIAVVHRLDTILDFDRIVFLENGRIVETGSPGALLARDSVFRNAYRVLKRDQDSTGNRQDDVVP